MTTVAQVPSYTALYYVRSRTTPNLYHAVVTLPNGRQRCECKAATNGHPCWHVKAVEAGIVRPAAMKVEAAFLPTDDVIPVPYGVIDNDPRAARMAAGRKAIADLYGD